MFTEDIEERKTEIAKLHILFFVSSYFHLEI